jgi:hypothetical protein
MPRIVRTALGELVDFDALILKQKIAQAPMSIEVARRKEFIDNKEGRGRGQRQPVAQTEPIVDEILIDPILEVAPVAIEVAPVTPADFEIDNPPPKTRK